MAAGEALAIVSGLLAALALALKKSKCFARFHDGAMQWGVGFTDAPIVPEICEHGNGAAARGAGNSALR